MANTPVITFRCPPELKAAIDRELSRRLSNPLIAPLTLTEFIVKALVEKLHKAARSRKSRSRKPDDTFNDEERSLVLGDDVLYLPLPPEDGQ